MNVTGQTPLPSGGSALAVVIPAYKGRHFGELLESFAQQTDQRFTVYIGDDASPDDLGTIARSFESRMSIRYVRFAENWGAHAMVDHWARCVALSQGEPWIWVFGDDDRAEPECVAAFYRAAAENPECDLFRFGLDFIGEHGEFLRRAPNHPESESGVELLRAMLTDNVRQWRAADHIFSRRAYEQHGGFERLPHGMYADCAGWIKFARRTGVCTISGPRVHWRTHPASISTGYSKVVKTRCSTLLQFIDWLGRWTEAQGPEWRDVFEQHAVTYLTRQMGFFIPAITSEEFRETRSLCRKHFTGRRLDTWVQLQQARTISHLRARGWAQRLRRLRPKTHSVTLP
jgi:hypothetical protein